MLPTLAAATAVLAACGAKAMTDPNVFNGESCSAEATGVRLEHVASYATGLFDESAAEAVDFDAKTATAIFVNAAAAQVQALDVSGLGSGAVADTVENLPVPAEYTPNSVAVSNGLVAVALALTRTFEDAGSEFTEQLPGAVGFYERRAGAWAEVGFVDFGEDRLQRSLLRGSDLPMGYAGCLPDMVTFTPDGKKVVVAIEGEATFDETEEEVAFDRRNPEGSVIQIAVSRSKRGDYTFKTFNIDFRSLGLTTAFDCRRCRGDGAVFLPQLYADGREFGGAIDVEPEFIAISDDSRTAYVTLQENNAMAIVSLRGRGRVLKVVGLSRRDASVTPIDVADNGRIELAKYPGLFSLYQPDSIAYTKIGGKGYVLTANEGDERDGENTDVEDVEFSPALIASLGEATAARFADGDDLGGLSIHASLGLSSDGVTHDEIVSYGGRSFSIFDADGARVFDSGAEIPQKVLELIEEGKLPKEAYNVNNDGGELDNRSDNKGVEPEAIDTGAVGGGTYAFVGLERNSGLVVYDISTPAAPTLLQYVARREFTEEGTDEPATADLGPEYIRFVAADESPIDEAIIIVSNEVSGTVSFWKVNDCSGGHKSRRRPKA